MSPQGMSVALYDLFRVRDRRARAVTCAVWPMWPVSWEESGPLVTAVVWCDPVVCGLMWPQRSRPWKARPGSPLSRDPTPMAQVKSVCDGPLLTVRDRQLPMLRAAEGTACETNPALAWPRWSQAQPEGEGRLG
jgi:hypothetical protein